MISGEKRLNRNGIKIRRMTIRDYGKAAGLWKKTKGVGLDESDDRKSINKYLKRNRGMSFVAYHGNKLAGAVLCGHEGRRGYLHHLAVAAEYRNRGLGKLLVERCLSALKKQKIPKCNLFLFSDNKKVRSFWLHNGWKMYPGLELVQKVIA